MGRKKAGEGKSEPPVLVLTGEMRDGMHLIRVYGREMYVS